jgi:bacterial/archaeal transporter family-2 protein
VNNLGVYLLLPLSLAIGFSLASQAGVNSQLRLSLSNPIQAAFISFLVGTIILGVISLAQGNAWFKSGSLAQIPWWAWLGGVFGAFNIAMSVYLAPKLGAVVLTLSVVCGQMIASVLFDQNGWLGYPKIDITWNRVVGIILIFAGVLFVAKR